MPVKSLNNQEDRDHFANVVNGLCDEFGITAGYLVVTMPAKAEGRNNTYVLGFCKLLPFMKSLIKSTEAAIASMHSAVELPITRNKN